MHRKIPRHVFIRFFPCVALRGVVGETVGFQQSVKSHQDPYVLLNLPFSADGVKSSDSALRLTDVKSLPDFTDQTVDVYTAYQML